MDNLLDSLNDKQAEAVQYTNGPLLILAGAGSGKTRVITHRIGYILREDLARPWQILAITFTNKAAGEMRERVDRLIPGEGHDVFVSTFHSMCVRMLRRDIEKLGYSRDFTIYDTDDQKTLMRGIIKDLKLDNKQYREKGILAVISSCKNEMTDASEYEKCASDFYERNIAKAYHEYEKRLKQNNALDFDDLLLKTAELFLEFPEVLSYWQNRFLYIMVDEYQDTNNVQFELVRLLSGLHKNLCVVGDDDQSIYKFRGADVTNILSFEKTFPGTKVIKLEQNYRSTKSIINAANSVIKHNKGRKDKTLWTGNEEGKLPRYKEFYTAQDEADAVIKEAASCDFPFGEQAVLYRTNAQSRLFEEKCIRNSVPYVIVGGVNFYQRKEIKDILAYLKVIVNGSDDLSTARVLNVPKRGIGDTTAGKVSAYAAAQGMSFYDALCICREIPGLNSGACSKIDAFTDKIEELRGIAKDTGSSLKRLIEAVRDDTGYIDELTKDGAVEAAVRVENIEELISKAVSFEEEYLTSQEAEDITEAGIDAKMARLSRFLEDVSLVADIDRADTGSDRLTLMTLHGAKGLEFNKVYLAGMEEGLFPSFASINGDDPEEEIEEERRLCYVGMTRARKELFMTGARERMINGETRTASPSRFVKELPPDGVEMSMLKKKAASWDDGYDADEVFSFGNSFSFGSAGSSFGSSYSAESGSSFPRSSYSFGSLDTGKAGNDLSSFVKGSQIPKVKPDYAVGDRVKSVKFGEGTVAEITEQPKDYQVTVDFDDFGVKKLLAGFAKLMKV